MGFATAGFRLFGAPANAGQIWVAVQPAARHRGAGSVLFQNAEAHLRAHGATTVALEVLDNEGEIFATERGFRHASSEVVSILDVRSAKTDKLEQYAKRCAADGFELAPLRALISRPSDLFEFYGAAGAWPSSSRGVTFSFDEWKSAVFEHPELDRDGSFVVTSGAEPVALASLLVDRERGLAENEWTATLPELRGRGLARLAKLATIRWAAGHAITELGTENDKTNTAIRRLNAQLGYREVALVREFERAVSGAETAFVQAPAGPAQ